MKNSLVTVVLPIFNVEPYLNRCILSVVNQTYSNLEILLIDDGSTDNCPQICDEWALKDKRIQVIHKQNEGLGMARNTGIEYATGEYICFFDSDDYIAPDAIEHSYLLAKKEFADIVVFGHNDVDLKNNIVKRFVPSVGNRVYVGDEVMSEFFPDFIAPSPHSKEPPRFHISAWVLLYSTNMIKSSGWRFVSEREIISEDVYSLLSLFQYVNKVAVLPEALYYYCKNNDSLSRKYRPDRYERIKHFYLESLKLCEKLGYDSEIIHRVWDPYISFTIAALKQECKISGSYKNAVNAVRHIAEDEVFQKALAETKKDAMPVTRKILFTSLSKRWYLLSVMLFRLKK